MSTGSPWIWQQSGWPELTFDAAALALPLETVAQAIGRLHGRVGVLHDADRDRAALAGLMHDVIESSAIEGERLDVEAVRSSLARRLGVDMGGAARMDRHADGVVEMTLDATRNAGAPLTAKRLQAWQAALFPTGRSGLSEIRVGQWRDDGDGPTQVVSGPIGRQRVHFEAPPAAVLDGEVAKFLEWVEAPSGTPGILRAGLAHLWFVTLHPVDDGNGRVARAVGDLMLSRADGEPYRYYSLSAQIQAERNAYYDILERTQRGGLDVTAWLSWFLRCLLRAVRRSDAELDRVLAKVLFWQRVADVPLTGRQVKALNKVLDEFEQPVTNRKWAALTRTSSDTALRDLRALVEAGVLERADTGGRSSAYWLKGIPPPRAED
ncbi:Fic family protein [Lysobacter sp. GX 14042]|uniref:Fic family protein n=1 Tax=Lysobacter sp. GX 14042 TaxID=2907155 RepID=UPI001F1E8F75|nr:Fic family protein [Lysobacter sp. GX 14042]MCE7033363.1 Fic family protein [Lysobacter sp. GX 14042]